MSNWILTSSVLILAILLIRKFFGTKLPIGLQYGLWLLVLVRLFIPVSFFNSSYSLIEIVNKAVNAAERNFFAEETEVHYLQSAVKAVDEANVAQNREEVVTEYIYITPSENVTTYHDAASEKKTTTHTYTYVPTEKIGRLESWLSENALIFYAVWLIGAVAVSGFFLLANLFFRIRIYSDRVEVEEDELKKRGLSSEIPVYVTKYVSTPCLAGLRCSAVYLPLTVWEKKAESGVEKTVESSADKEAECGVEKKVESSVDKEAKSGTGEEAENRKLDAMICHENVHFQHGDQLWGFLRLFCLSLHWYNPLVWAAALLSRQDAELFCDAGTVRKLGEDCRYEYGRLLVHITQEDKSAGRLSACMRSAGLCNTEMADTKKHIQKRIEKLTEVPKKGMAVVALTLLFGLMTLGYLFMGSERTNFSYRNLLAKYNKKYDNGQETIVVELSNQQGEAVITEEHQYFMQGTLESTTSADAAPQVMTEHQYFAQESAAELFFPSEEEVKEVREIALKGMHEEERKALTTYVKDYHNWLEYRLLYEDWEAQLSNKESIVWNFFDKTGEVVAGYALEKDAENYPEFGKLTLKELAQKCGEPYYEENRYGSERVVERMRELTASAEDEAFCADVEALCKALLQAKDTHEVDYVKQAHEILHDMEYFLLRYSPKDVAPYTKDKSLSCNYYGVLEVWRR